MNGGVDEREVKRRRKGGRGKVWTVVQSHAVVTTAASPDRESVAVSSPSLHCTPQGHVVVAVDFIMSDLRGSRSF